MYQSPEIWARKLVHEEEPWDSSAQILEAQTGLNGIAGHYRMPEGISRESLDAFANQETPYFAAWKHSSNRNLDLSQYPQLDAFIRRGYERLPLLVDMINRIAQVNPELKHIRFNRFDIQEVTNVLSGILYDFNPNDILYFVNGQANRNPAYRDAEWERLREAVSAVAEPDYIPSPATMVDIIERHPAARKKAKVLGLDLNAIKARLASDPSVIPAGAGQLEHRHIPSRPTGENLQAADTNETDEPLFSIDPTKIPPNVPFLLTVEQSPAAVTAKVNHDGRINQISLDKHDPARTS